MKQHLNTLFITQEDTYLAKDGAAVVVRQGGAEKLRVPLHNLSGIQTFGWDIGASPALLAACAEAGVTVSFCTPHGHFQAASIGFTSGSVLLRREQYRRADDAAASSVVARGCLAAKIANSRSVLQRALRDHASPEREKALRPAVERLGHLLTRLFNRPELSVDDLRGIEGDSAHEYFQCFPLLLVGADPEIQFTGRSRRPPLDPVNALLSFLYSLLAHDVRSACEACGLDPQVGFLHRDRPGRPSLALDLMEEFRPFLADRVALNLLNRRQLTPTDFDYKDNGAVLLQEPSRKTVLMAWQERKREEILHPFLDEKVTIGLLPHLQARLLARHLRGDLDAYPGFLWR